jgi:hypothetical protein
MDRKLSSPLPPVALAVLLAAVAGPAAAQITGTFVDIVKADCIDAVGGFNSVFEPLAAPVFSSVSTTAGFRTLNANGTGTFTGRGTGNSVPIPPGTFSSTTSAAAAFTLTDSFNYTVSSEGIITFTLQPGTYLQTYTTGPRAGQTATLDVLTTLGFLTPDGKTLVRATGTTYVETKTYSNGDVVTSVCNRSANGVLQ